jgi:hypothetical protein
MPASIFHAQEHAPSQYKQSQLPGTPPASELPPMRKQEDRSTTVTCDLQGRVINLVRDSLGFRSRLTAGTSVTGVADQQDYVKALLFLEIVRDAGAAFDWEINVLSQGGLKPLYWAGQLSQSGTLVITLTSAPNGMTQLGRELMRMHRRDKRRSLPSKPARRICPVPESARRAHSGKPLAERRRMVRSTGHA